MVWTMSQNADHFMQLVHGIRYYKTVIHTKQCNSCTITLRCVVHAFAQASSCMGGCESQERLLTHYCMIVMCIHTIEGNEIPDLGDKNRAAAVKWRAMSQEDKQPFFQLASQIPTVPQNASSSAYNTWHETQRILSNMQDNVR